MTFEKYTPPKKGRKTASKPPQVKILKSGIVSFNAPAYGQYLKGAKFVELFYDSDAKKIGLRPKKYPTKSGFPIKAVGKGKATYRVNTKPVFERYGIDASTKKSVKPVWNEGEALLEISV